MIRFTQVHFSYGEKAVVKDFSFTIPPADVTLLTGPSGCGKTTLLRLIAGLETPQRGEVRAPSTAILFQENRLFPWRNALQQLTDVLGAEREQQALELLDMVELLPEKNAMPSALSGGMQRRLSLARTFALQRELYLLDEPFAGIDEELRKRIMTRLRQKKVPILMNGHEESLSELADQIIRFDGPPISVQV